VVLPVDFELLLEGLTVAVGNPLLDSKGVAVCVESMGRLELVVVCFVGAGFVLVDLEVVDFVFSGCASFFTTIGDCVIGLHKC
jgi:hypothetical protein